jgi:hypothetical protein
MSPIPTSCVCGSREGVRRHDGLYDLWICSGCGRSRRLPVDAELLLPPGRTGAAPTHWHSLRRLALPVLALLGAALLLRLLWQYLLLAALIWLAWRNRRWLCATVRRVRYDRVSP